jgi:hypothetical protein
MVNIQPVLTKTQDEASDLNGIVIAEISSLVVRLGIVSRELLLNSRTHIANSSCSAFCNGSRILRTYSELAVFPERSLSNWFSISRILVPTGRVLPLFLVE